MNKIIGIFILLSTALIISGCSSIKATPTEVSYFEHPCEALPTFSIRIEQTPLLPIPPFTQVKAFLIANGIEVQMTGPPGGGKWGMYWARPALWSDGEVRYRYRVESKRFGYPRGEFYRPRENYLVTPMGKITWSSPNSGTTEGIRPNMQGPWHGFNRMIVFETMGPSTGGTETADTPIIITNGYDLDISFSDIYILSEPPPTGLGVSEFSITSHPAGNPITFPVIIPSGESEIFSLSYTDSYPPHGRTTKNVVVLFKRDTATGICFFGPIHIQGSVVADDAI